jgi:magnesium transporter
MIFANSGHAPRHTIAPDSHPAEAGAQAAWIDLLEPDQAEREYVERLTGLRVPGLGELSEIESSSRLHAKNGVLFLSTPVVARADRHDAMVSPLGFVLSRDRLLTVRFTALKAFDVFADNFAESDDPPPCSAGAFIGLLEAIVDRLADVLERVGGELDALSDSVFSAGRGRKREDRRLQEELRAIGRTGDLLSHIRDSLLGVGRIVPFVDEMAAEWTPATLRPRFKTLRQDIASLNDYDVQLMNKVQFLLDATLGLINIEQNNGIKILTVVSVVGVPPTLVASIYGMNFKGMPELNWAWGYPYGLAVIALSAILPLLWFKRRGWL